jgi:hypothetical protein
MIDVIKGGWGLEEREKRVFDGVGKGKKNIKKTQQLQLEKYRAYAL